MVWIPRKIGQKRPAIDRRQNDALTRRCIHRGPAKVKSDCTSPILQHKQAAIRINMRDDPFNGNRAIAQVAPRFDGPDILDTFERCNFDGDQSCPKHKRRNYNQCQETKQLCAGHNSAVGKS